jgi:hypothetical protein
VILVISSQKVGNRITFGDPGEGLTKKKKPGSFASLNYRIYKFFFAYRSKLLSLRKINKPRNLAVPGLFLLSG